MTPFQMMSVFGQPLWNVGRGGFFNWGFEAWSRSGLEGERIGDEIGTDLVRSVAESEGLILVFE